MVVALTPGDYNSSLQTGDAEVLASLFWRSYDEIGSCFTKMDNVCMSYGLCALSASLSVFACLILIYQRCYLRKHVTVNAATCATYCFVGNLCHSVGAFLSKQMPFQVLMGAFWAALDGVTFLAILLPICLFIHSEKGRRMRMLKRRRRQNVLMVVFMLAVGGGIHFAAKSHVHTVGQTSANRRRLLSVFTQVNVEHLGYMLGLLSFVISWTSHFPTILQAYNRKRRRLVHTGILFAAAGGLYIAAILVYDTRAAFVVKALPWIMSSACAGFAELLYLTVVYFLCGIGGVIQIFLLSLRRLRSGHHMPGRFLNSDREALLGATCDGSNRKRKRSRKCQDVFLTNNNVPKRSDMGHYMDVNVQPVRKVCLKEVKISYEGQSEGQQPKKTVVKVVRVDDTCSVSSSDTSTFNSDLEWDFEEAASLQCCRVSVKQDWAEAFPLEQWTAAPTTTLSSVSAPAPSSAPCCRDNTMATARPMPGDKQD